ncbi:RdgB/HAM1 family non-canonical purine NTP pyrophosphatase [Legionella maceachernii]|uniref:dITP/XTP pyrophosphatase n=1 Tax=Legionella maceachernii TaxID=466 RepID=A0A0W0W459_9GAMM|nr:RdgB/HAM1 family non-canonical purine NTP pyrophosphatase [Legionella maceachernii]KTD27160.1 deoxyribonucleotide triphosphate pyrophosphatase [Legionella maceachernii]SKA13815.1 XTP/dITP diphosphohydrolase [Legionella maceachernii]SUP04820.1 dITP/XTP pyrophosphatase [Legionella maceachernii]
MKEIILATSNKGKIAELEAILSPWHCIPQTSLGIKDAEETGLSFVENAIIKARHASQLGNKPALADDSGLVVQALNGAPGIYSARYAGMEASDNDNIQLLLNNLAAIPDSQRQAFFYCAIALVKHADDPTPLIAIGRLMGKITHTPMGDQGFGYDPIFYIESQQCTAAQLPAKIKNSISHRAQALNQLRKQLESIL